MNQVIKHLPKTEQKKKKGTFMNQDSITRNQFIIGLIVTFMLAMIPAAMAYGALTNKVDQAEKTLEIIPFLQEDIHESYTRNSILETKIDILLEEVSDVKSDVKDIQKNVNTHFN